VAVFERDELAAIRDAARWPLLLTLDHDVLTAESATTGDRARFARLSAREALDAFLAAYEVRCALAPPGAASSSDADAEAHWAHDAYVNLAAALASAERDELLVLRVASERPEDQPLFKSAAAAVASLPGPSQGRSHPGCLVTVGNDAERGFDVPGLPLSPHGPGMQRGVPLNDWELPWLKRQSILGLPTVQSSSGF